MRIRKQIKIKGDYIRLDQLLKLGGFVDSGGHAKMVILEGNIKVNGQIVIQRGKKIREGDRVVYNDIEIEVIN